MSRNSEEALCGALLLYTDLFDNLPEIRPEHFSVPEYGELFGYIRAEIIAGHAVDTISIWERIKGETLGNVFSFADLSTLATNAGTPASSKRHAEVIIEGSQLRAIKAVCVSAMAQVQSGATAEQVTNYISAQLNDGLTLNRRGPVSLAEVLSSHTEAMERRLDGQIKRVSTGLTDLDELLGGGMNGGDLVIIAGRPAMGKSAASLGIARYNADPILIVNMEMSNEQTADRFVAAEGSAPLGWLRNPKEEKYWANYTHAIHRLQDSKVFLDDCPSQSVYSIRSSARQIQRKHGLGAVIVDYLSLMEGSDAKERHNQVAEFSRGLKKLAKELNVPVVALAQLSRKCEERMDKRPIMADLRESGQIEQDADTIIFLYRDEVYNPDSRDKGVAELIVAKQRQGALGVVPAVFQGQFTRFENMAREWVRPEPAKPSRRGWD